jgi:hypothetical protein
MRCFAVKPKPRRGSVEYLMELIEAKDFILFKTVVNFVPVRYEESS